MQLALPTLIFVGIIIACAGTATVSQGDDLAPLLKAEQSDPSSFHGLQIRPQESLVSVFQTLPLEVKYCFRHLEGEASYWECNKRFAGLPEGDETIVVTSWRVNGIEGGNTVVGSIKAEGRNKALYTAPKTAPQPATVAISAQVDTQSKVGGLDVINVTIVDGKFYMAEMGFTGEQTEQGEVTKYSGSAKMVFDFAESFDGGVRYDIVPASPWRTKMFYQVKLDRWTVQDDSRRCQLNVDQLGSNRVSFDPNAPISGSLFLYSSLESYIFSTLMYVVAPHKCVSGDTTWIEDMELTLALTTQKNLTDPGYQQLAGTGESLLGTSLFQKPAEEDGDLSVVQSISWKLWREYNRYRNQAKE